MLVVVGRRTTTTTTTMMLVNHHPSKKSSSSSFSRRYITPFTVCKNRHQNRALFSSKKETEETDTALAANGLLTQIGSRQNFLRVSANEKSKPRRGESSIVFSGGGGGWNDDVAFRECSITRNTKATEKGELYALAVSLPKNDIEESMMLKKFSIPGQFVQMKTVETDKPAFIAIANGPTNARATRRFEFLVKRPKEGYRDATTGEEMASTAQKLCDAEVSTKVLVSEPMGKGFRVPSSEIGEVLCFATGSGISPVKSLLEEGFFDDDENTTKGRETHVFYGTRDKEHTAFAEELKNTLGGRVNIIHAYSADGNGYAQDYFKRMVDSGELTLKDPKKTIAVLCGQKEMTEQTIEVLEKVGVPRERILMNF
jgi:ferredoxin-NADP reductase